MNKENLNNEEMAVELPNGTVVIPMEHYEELVADSVRVNIVRKMYLDPKVESWDYEHILAFMFGEKPKAKSEEDGEDHAE